MSSKDPSACSHGIRLDDCDICSPMFVLSDLGKTAAHELANYQQIAALTRERDEYKKQAALRMTLPRFTPSRPRWSDVRIPPMWDE